ncbi:peptidoglycan-binding protein [Streptomyces venetus]|uniref:peptidoglycan-binding protein n=1 Tax=Streptomyces venetus TaxID=1701086 RepID=UPI003C2B7A3B
MDQPNGHPCPECGAPRRPDNTPSCACTHRAAEALRDARTAQAAAAEDFDPLRIRPYVELDPKTGPDRATADGAAPRHPAGDGPAVSAHEEPPGSARPAGPAPEDATRRTRVDGRPAPRRAETSHAGRTAGDSAGPSGSDGLTSTPEGSQPPPRADAPAAPPHAAHPNGSATPSRTERTTELTTERAHPRGPARSLSAEGGATPQHVRTSPGEGSARAAEGAPHPSHPNGPATPPSAEGPRADGPARTPEGGPQGTVANPADTFRAEGAAAPPPSPADTTMPLRPVDPDATTVLPAAQDTTALPVPPDTTVLPTPLAPAASEPSVTDLRLFDGAGASEDGAPGAAEDGGGSGGRRRGVLLAAAAAACVAVVAVAGYASGLFAYEAPSRDTALPDDIRASVPDGPSSSVASTPAERSAPATPSAPAAPPPSPSATSSPSASPSSSAPSASPSPSRSATPSAPQTSASPTGPGQAPPDNSRQNGGPTTLRLGDRGPEVTELQLRLRQLSLYDEDDDGTYDERLEDAVRTYQWSRGIQDDDLGVYGRGTRTRLESETKEP